MSSKDIINKPNYWYMKAEELRAQAETMRHEAPRAKMYEIASQFEVLARLLDQELRSLLDPNFATADSAEDRRNVTQISRHPANN